MIDSSFLYVESSRNRRTLMSDVWNVFPFCMTRTYLVWWVVCASYHWNWHSAAHSSVLLVCLCIYLLETFWCLAPTYDRHLLSDICRVVVVEHTPGMLVSDAIVTNNVLRAILAALDNAEIWVTVLLGIVVFSSIEGGCQNHTRLIQASTPQILWWVVVKLISILSLDLVWPLIVVVH